VKIVTIATLVSVASMVAALKIRNLKQIVKLNMEVA